MATKAETIRIDCHVPSKKNSLRPRRGGGLMNDREKAQQIDGIVFLLKEQWKGRAAVSCASIEARFFVPTLRGDADNAYTTLQDCMVKAGILKGDNRARVPQFGVMTRRSKEEYVEIDIVPLVEDAQYG